MIGALNSFSDDIVKCLFQYWTQYAGGNKYPPAMENQLAVRCAGPSRRGLCYGPKVKGKSSKALFAVCYNVQTLIPEFTGHVLQPGSGGSGNQGNFRGEGTLGRPY